MSTDLISDTDQSGNGRMKGEFVSERIEPVKGTFDTGGMTRGEPGLPARFVWRGKEYVVAELQEKWKESGPCKSGSPEVYLRKHWFRIRCTDGTEMTLYFERQPRTKAQGKTRWWLYTIKATEGETKNGSERP